MTENPWKIARRIHLCEHVNLHRIRQGKHRGMLKCLGCKRYFEGFSRWGPITGFDLYLSEKTRRNPKLWK